MECAYQVIEAHNADEAKALLRASAPDIVISDVRMPGSLDGLGLLAFVRDNFPALPVILMSAHLEASQAIAGGAAKFIAKPFEYGQMAEAVRNSLGQP